MITASSSTKAGSKAASPSCAMPISGVPIDWCAPPSGASVTPEGVADEHEAGILVAGIVQRIEAALDERIVERADRQQPLAEERMRQAERREHG